MLPEGWQSRELGDLLTLEYGDGLPQRDRRGQGYSVYGSSGVIGRHSEALVEGPGIVVGRKGTVGAVVWSPGDFWPIDTTYYVQPKEKLDFRWLYWLLLQSKLGRLDASTGVPGLNRYEAYAVAVPVPPLGEQRRIAAILDAADEAILQSERVITKLRQVKTGLLHDLLTRGLDADGNLRDPEAHLEQFKDSPLGRIPRAWEVVETGKLFRMQLGKMLSKASKSGQNPFAYLANRNVQWDRVDLSDLEWMDFDESEREKYALSTGDLLVCEGGEIGRTAMWHGEMENCYYQKAIHRLRPKGQTIIPGYMLRFMHFAVGKSFFVTLTSQTSIAHLTQEKFALLPVAVPPRDEQRSIASILDTHDARIRADEATLDKLRQVKRGLMDDLLTGRVRVTG